MEKQADGIELLKLLYRDEAHITLPRDTRCRAMRMVLDTLAESQKIFADGEKSIHRALFSVPK